MLGKQEFWEGITQRQTEGSWEFAVWPLKYFTGAGEVMFSPGLARVKLGEQSRAAVWWLRPPHRECWPKAVPGVCTEARRRSALGSCGLLAWRGGREIPFVSPMPFLVLSRRGSSPAFQGMGYWSAGLCQQSCKTAASGASEHRVTAPSEFWQGIPEESGCPLQPCGTRSWANVSDQAFAYGAYQGSVWDEKQALLMPLPNSLGPHPDIHILWIFGCQSASAGKLVGLIHCLL